MGRAAPFWASTGSQTVSILQLIPFLKGARVLFSREWAGLLVSQTVSILQLVPFLKGARVLFSRGPFGAWVGGTFFLKLGKMTLAGRGRG